MKYGYVIAEVLESLWMIRREKMWAIAQLLARKEAGDEISAEEIALIKREAPEPYAVEIDPLMLAEDDGIEASEPVARSRARAGSIAVLPIHGTISHRMSMMTEMSGGVSAERLSGWLRSALADASINSVVLDIDSPGGTVHGVPELAEEIYQGRSEKPIIAVANAQAASAAYYLGSQASEFVVTPSGSVGSIGVFAAHEDISKAMEAQGVKVTLISAGKYKTEANPLEPLSDEARAALQANVDHWYGMFTKAVARGRNTTQSKVQDGFGQGRMKSAVAAKEEGMVDRIATLDQTLRRLGARRTDAALPDYRKKPLAAAPDHAVANELRRRELELYT